MPELRIDRRDLFRRAVPVAAAFSAASYSRILGANNRVRVGMIGLGIRGPYVMSRFQKVPDTEVAALCDVYGERVDQARKNAPNAQAFSDYRKMIELKDLDAVDIATPDHWHCPIAIEAMNAGKDVYVEKPLSLRIEEGPEVMRVARMNGRICQVGTQRRSSQAYQGAKLDYFDSGRIGKLTLFRTWWHHNLVHARQAPPALKTKPDNLDWGRFLGPAKWREWDPQQYWNFRGYFDFGGGMITDLFTHLVDVLHWYTGQEFPVAVTSAGGIYTYKDGRTAPDTIHSALEYPGGYVATFDAAIAGPFGGAGLEFLGTKGRLTIEKNQTTFQSAEPKSPPIVKQYTDDADYNHVANFVECMRTRKTPNADALVGHRSAQASHLCNIAYRKARRIVFDPGREEIVS